MRTVTIIPEGLCIYTVKDEVVIKTDKDVSFDMAYRVAMRMMPDKIVIYTGRNKQ